MSDESNGQLAPVVTVDDVKAVMQKAINKQEPQKQPKPLKRLPPEQIRILSYFWQFDDEDYHPFLTEDDRNDWSRDTLLKQADRLTGRTVWPIEGPLMNLYDKFAFRKLIGKYIEREPDCVLGYLEFRAFKMDDIPIRVPTGNYRLTNAGRNVDRSAAKGIKGRRRWNLSDSKKLDVVIKSLRPDLTPNGREDFVNSLSGDDTEIVMQALTKTLNKYIKKFSHK